MPTLDLLSILLGTGTRERSVREVALELLGERGLDAPCLRDPGALRGMKGIGDAKAARILSALELGARVGRGTDRARMASLADVSRWARPRLSELEHEELWLLCLDSQNGVRAELAVAVGGALGCSLTPSDVLRPAVRNGASAVILVHNHPSGDPTPSQEDLQMTRSLQRACRVVGVTLLDHVVVARSGASSIVECLHGVGGSTT
jgi:DNA repair protein RadC